MSQVIYFHSFTFNFNIRIFIVESFLEVGPFPLQQSGGKFIYSECFNQDPMEAFFGQQRTRGGRNNNPTVQ